MKLFFKCANDLYLSRLCNRYGALSVLTAGFSCFIISKYILNIDGDFLMATPGILFGFYIGIVGEVGHLFYVEKKKAQLESNLKSPSGFTWVVYNSEDLKIGEIDEATYLKGKYRADTCMTTKLLQLFNIILVPLVSIYRVLKKIPIIMLLILLLFVLVEPSYDYSKLTLGHMMNFMVENTWMFIQFFLIIMMIGFPVLLLAGKKVPGYTNYHNRRLKRILSKDMPILAVCDGFSVTGFKVTVEVNEA